MEKCQKFAQKMPRNACTWHESDDLTSCGQSSKLARSVTKWTQACDRRLARLNSYRQYCHVENTAQHCRRGVFQDSDFAGGLEDS